jgi:hypothetical protein
MATKIINIGSHVEKSLVECNDQGLPEPIQIAPPEGCVEKQENKGNWLEDASNKKIDLGVGQQCDPMQTGQIINETGDIDKGIVYRYSKAQRACDEAMLDMFRNLTVIDEDGKAHPIPIIWGSQEKAVAYVLSQSPRKDNSLVVDRIKLPIMAIFNNSVTFDQSRYVYHKAIDYMRRYRPDSKPGFTTKEKYERDTIFGMARGIPINFGYTLYLWTLYLEDMNQLVEQVVLKFSPIAYIYARGIPWETGVKLESIANNVDLEPGDQAIRVIKYEFNFTVEAYIPQPIVRQKAVLKTKIDIMNSVDEKTINEVLDRIEESVKELE